MHTVCCCISRLAVGRGCTIARRENIEATVRLGAVRVRSPTVDGLKLGAGSGSREVDEISLHTIYLNERRYAVSLRIRDNARCSR